jgi:hypothetical protein
MNAGPYTTCILMLCSAGGIYEYTVELASKGAAPSLERLAAKLAGAVAEELRRKQSSIMEHSPPPGVADQHGTVAEALSSTAKDRARTCSAPAAVGMHSSAGYCGKLPGCTAK